MDVVERLPIHYGLTNLMLFILQSVIFHIMSWVDGWLPAYTFSPLVLVFPPYLANGSDPNCLCPDAMTLILQVVLAVAAFALPLGIVARRLVSAKRTDAGERGRWAAIIDRTGGLKCRKLETSLRTP